MFSIIIPVHNKEPHIKRSVESVLNQTYQVFELILIDDASTDGSNEILESFSDPRIKIFHRDIPGPGGYAARNLGILKSKYGWISFLDADDAWELNYLEEIKKGIEINLGSELLTTKWDNIYDDKIVENRSFDKYFENYVDFSLIDFLNDNFFVWTSCVTIKKSLIQDAGMFPEHRCKRGGDMDAWIRCLEKSNRNIWINKKLAHYYKETVNQVTSNKNNPVDDICSLSTLEALRKRNSNGKLMKAINKFLYKIIYNKILLDYRRNIKPDFRLVNKIDSFIVRYRLRLKLFIRIRFLEK